MSEVRISNRKRKLARKSSSTSSGSRWQGLILFGVIGLIMLLIAGQLRTLFLRHLIDYYEVEMGTLERELVVDKAILLRDEMVFLAPNTGIITQLVPEGQRVAEGEIVARVQSDYGGNQGIRAARAGVVCYHTDGLENVLSPASADTLKLSELEVPADSLKEIGQGTQVERGQPVVKIINNLTPFMIWMEFDVEHLHDFPGVREKIRFRLGEQEYEAVLDRLETRGVISQGLLKLERGELFHERGLKIALILESVKGLKIPNKALVRGEDTEGVYKAFPKGYRYTPVTVLLQDQEYSIVEGLSRGDRIIANPLK